MAIAGKPLPTTYQIGTEVYYLNSAGAPAKSKVEKTVSKVTSADSYVTAVQANVYYLEATGDKQYQSTELYATGELLQAYLDGLVDALDPQA